MCNEEVQPCLTLSRRKFLLLAGTSLALSGCYRQAPPPPDTQPATHPKNPAPDLGSEIFPDPLGRPLVAASAAPVIIIPRYRWTTQPPNLAEMYVMNGVNQITIHHSGFKNTFETDSWQDTVTSIEGIREFHVGHDRQWADIAYHFVVDHVGRVWQGRPLVYQGAHAKNHNDHNLGIVLMGNFDLQVPSAAQLAALSSFITFLRDLYAIAWTDIHTHGELVKTGCPGKMLQSFMDRARLTWSAA